METISIVKVLGYLVRFAKREIALIAKIEYRILILLIKLYNLPLVVRMYNRQSSVLILLVSYIELKRIE